MLHRSHKNTNMGTNDTERTTSRGTHGTDQPTPPSKAAGRASTTQEHAADGQAAQRAELVFILDASGSMGGLESDTVGGFNAMIEENRGLPGEATVSLVTFNTSSHVVLDRVDIAAVPALTRERYRCCGCTALLDAVGGAIEHIDLVQRVQPAGYQADRVFFAITTDGLENASRKYSYRQVKRLIEQHREMGWEFIFIGANIDVEAEAERLGIARDHAVGYVPDEAGTGAVYRAAACASRAVRMDAPLAASDWRRELDEDVQRRGR